MTPDYQPKPITLLRRQMSAISRWARRVPTVRLGFRLASELLKKGSNMKHAIRIVLLSGIVALTQASCAQTKKVGDMFTGQGTGEFTDIGNRQFDISAAGGFSGNRGDTYAKWDRTAKLACKGGEYKIIKRDWQDASYPGILGGIIECINKKP